MLNKPLYLRYKNNVVTLEGQWLPQGPHTIPINSTSQKSKTRTGDHRKTKTRIEGCVVCVCVALRVNNRRSPRRGARQSSWIECTAEQRGWGERNGICARQEPDDCTAAATANFELCCPRRAIRSRKTGHAIQTEEELATADAFF